MLSTTMYVATLVRRGDSGSVRGNEYYSYKSIKGKRGDVTAFW